MAVPSRSAPLGLSKDSRLVMSSWAGAFARVNATPGATTVVITDVTPLNGISLYSASKPGMLVVVNCAAGTTHHSKTANITALTGTTTGTLTVDVDFSAILAAGDVVAVLPPNSVEAYVTTNTLHAGLSNNYDMAINEQGPTNNTPLYVDVNGDLTFYAAPTSETMERVLAFAFGQYKKARTVTDGVLASSTTVTSVTAAFTSDDIGLPIVSSTDIPTGAYITAVASATSITISAAATATGSGKTLVIGGVAGAAFFRPTINVGSTGFTSMPDATFVAMDGKSGSNTTGVITRAFFGMFPTRTTIEFPDGGLVRITLSNRGNGAVREIGGSGKSFPKGANKYIHTSLVADTGARLTTRGTFIDLDTTQTTSGSALNGFGAALSSSPLNAVKNATITIERGDLNDRTAGSAYILKPEETQFRVSVTGTRFLKDNTIQARADGATTDADQGTSAKATARLLFVAVTPNDTTKKLVVDIPNGVFEADQERRPAQARFEEDFTYNALFSLDTTTGQVSTNTPLVQVGIFGGLTKDISTTL